VRLPDHGPADDGRAVAELFSLQETQPARIAERRWSGLSVITFPALSDGSYLVRVDVPGPGGVRRIEVGAQLAGVSKELALPPRTATDWRSASGSTSAPAAPPSPTGAGTAPSIAEAASALRMLLALPPDSPALRWMPIAALEAGVSEQGGDADRRRISAYFADTSLPVSAHSADTPWSAAWLNWVFARAGIATPRSASNAAWLAWGRPADGPQPGSVAVIPTGSPNSGVPAFHAGLVIGARPDCIMLLSGNSRDRVEAACFRPDRVQSYRWPPLP
jgi:uncharacterized protein (TIGR02594 family)